MDFLDLLKKDKNKVLEEAKNTKGFLDILELQIYKAVSNSFKIKYKKVIYDLDKNKKIILRYIYKTNSQKDIFFQIVLLNGKKIRIYKNLDETKNSYRIKEVSYKSFVKFLKTKRFCFKN
ncbi:MAG: hypothetical protein ACQEQE_07250 [Bacillota bacterium]